MDIQIAGILALVAFYALFLAVGSYAARRPGPGRRIDELLLAGRALPLWIGVLTMVATWVGGGYLNGTAEAVYDPARGLVWAQAPWGYALSLVLAGLFFAGKMRKLGFRTLLDLYDRRYEKRVTAVLFIPALLGDVFWSSAVLVALGTTFATVLGLDPTTAIILSAAIAVGYTVIGGLRSVAYTDALQLLLIIVGLFIAVVAGLNYADGLSAVIRNYSLEFGDAASLRPARNAWDLSRPWGLHWIDLAFLLMLGGIPWQVYFQRVLACRDEKAAVSLSYLAGAGCVLAAVLAGLIGAIGATADWSGTVLGSPPDPAFVLPAVLRYLTPPLVATLGLAAIAAAVMSSVDSSILSAASMFTWNLYRPFRQKTPSDRHLTRVMRVAVVSVGLAATLLAINVQSVYTLWLLCSDLVYVVLFPQLVMALYNKNANGLGALAGVVVGLVLRIGGGEAILGLDPIIPYPFYDPELGVLFPFRTTSMLASLLTIWLVSRFTARMSPPRSLQLVRNEGQSDKGTRIG
jgi:high affinity choline transporter 7